MNINKKMEVKYFNYCSVDSTNDVALDHLSKIQNTKTAIVVTANIQEKGKGRNNKIWFSGANNLYYTFGFKHSNSIIPMQLIQVIGGLSVYNLLSEIVDEKNVRLKYPNDIYAKKTDDLNYFKKISGIKSEHIFIQNDICSSIIGIGINNKQEDFPKELDAISLINLNKNVTNDYLTERLTKIILELIATKKENIFGLWKEKLNLQNKAITIINNETGKQIKGIFSFKDILYDCRLSVIDNDGNTRIVDNGDSIRYDLN